MNASDLDLAIDPLAGAFRVAMRRHAAGVCIITCRAGDELNGMVVTSATSFSMDPPSVLVCLNQMTSLAPMVKVARVFGLTILGSGHEEVAARFSRKPSGAARFDQAVWRLDDDRQPWLEGAVANLSCVVERETIFGTHIAVIGRIVDVHLGDDVPSLIYRDGAYA